VIDGESQAGKESGLHIPGQTPGIGFIGNLNGKGPNPPFSVLLDLNPLNTREL
jgi:hypothetical protein